MSLAHPNPAQNVVVGAGKYQELLSGASSTVDGKSTEPAGACKVIQVNFSGTWTATTLVIETSLDGVTWNAELTLTATEMTASGLKWQNKDPIPYIRARITVYNATTGDVDVLMHS